MSRKLVFDRVRAMLGRGFTATEVKLLDAAIDAVVRAEPVASAVSGGLTPSQNAIDLMHEFEGCRLTAYPDPGSRDGKPWTIGYGSTGPGIGKGVVWTQKQADDRFASDLAKFSEKVRALLDGSGVPTTQSQFDAMVSLAYNIGVGAFGGSTVLRKHRAGDYAGAQAAFAMWNKNDGKVMAGLTRRRAAEAALYGKA